MNKKEKDKIKQMAKEIIIFEDLGVEEIEKAHKNNLDKRNKKRETICWACKNDKKCEWMNKKLPVKGWLAEETKIKSPTSINGRRCITYITSYMVIKCPNFRK